MLAAQMGKGRCAQHFQHFQICIFLTTNIAQNSPKPLDSTVTQERERVFNSYLYIY